MPRRMESSNETRALGTAQLERASERPASRKVKKFIGGLSVAAVASGLFVSAGGEAAADEQVFVGGNCDPGAGYVSQFYYDNGMANPGARKVNLNYPASIGPICGPTTERDSINIGADALMGEYLNNAPGEQFYAECFSLGAAVCDEFGRRVGGGGQIPANVHIINSGDGYNVTGALNNPFAIPARIVTDPMGVVPGSELHPAPGTVERFDVRDFWGNGGAQGFDIPALIGMLSSIGTNHRIPNPNEPHQTFVHNGVTYEVYGLDGNDPISQAIVNAGGDPTDFGRFFFGLIDGVNNPMNNPAYTHDPNFKSQINETVQTLTTPHNVVVENAPAVESGPATPPVAVPQTVARPAAVQPHSSVAPQPRVNTQPKPASITRREHTVKTGHGTVTPNVELVAKPRTFAHN